MNDSTAVILKTVFDYKKPALTIETDWCFVIGIVCLILLYIIYQKKIKSKLQNIFVQETSFEINTGLFKYNQKIKRSYQNLYVAHRIYIELVTKTASSPKLFLPKTGTIGLTIGQLTSITKTKKKSSKSKTKKTKPLNNGLATTYLKTNGKVSAPRKIQHLNLQALLTNTRKQANTK